MNEIIDNKSVVNYFVELFGSDENYFTEHNNTGMYFEPKKDNILVSLTGSRDAELALCEFKVKVETINDKNIVSFVFDKDSKGEDPNNLGINDKSVLKKYKELDNLFYAALENRKFEFTHKDLRTIKNEYEDGNLHVMGLLYESKISDKLKSDLATYVDDINKCIAYADKNYDKLMSVFNNMIMER